MAYFNTVNRIQFEGKQSRNPLAFKHYNKSEVVLGKTQEEHLRFAVAYWHTMTGGGSDPFGADTAIRRGTGTAGLTSRKSALKRHSNFSRKSMPRTSASMIAILRRKAIR